ncbi:hypothetical protein L7750_19825 [Xenorhabdus bovienii]|uniref:DUF7823 domain-containing protein n=3 Tax=Xenorhabdus bovienii TaxID=40576 RepID=A0A077PX64_XENBV|nr:hypothetical protein [Xenorhabdus bovienii]MCG3472523.1 hypothetical protein [Xenorhabdus bovienii]CDH02179.1 conserved hypothetical protein [Xenorhabdus bovienii str. feltiae Moldova]CDH25287.1 conserved hypothetical protein [Xenorhabdus bovienii str. kraussei Becker Underwood]
MSDVIKPEMNLEDYMLVFDLNLATGELDDGTQGWGYMSGKVSGGPRGFFGTLRVIQNKIDIKNMSNFYWNSPNFLSLSFRIPSDKGQGEPNSVPPLFQGNFYVTVDNVTYYLGAPYDSYERIGKRTYNARYDSEGALKLSAILKQTGQTKRFYCNWR